MTTIAFKSLEKSGQNYLCSLKVNDTQKIYELTLEDGDETQNANWDKLASGKVESEKELKETAQKIVGLLKDCLTEKNDAFSIEIEYLDPTIKIDDKHPIKYVKIDTDKECNYPTNEKNVAKTAQTVQEIWKGLDDVKDIIPSKSSSIDPDECKSIFPKSTKAAKIQTTDVTPSNTFLPSSKLTEIKKSTDDIDIFSPFKPTVIIKEKKSSDDFDVKRNRINHKKTLLEKAFNFNKNRYIQSIKKALNTSDLSEADKKALNTMSSKLNAVTFDNHNPNEYEKLLQNIQNKIKTIESSQNKPSPILNNDTNALKQQQNDPKPSNTQNNSSVVENKPQHSDKKLPDGVTFELTPKKK
jgi:hypothetical protein